MASTGFDVPSALQASFDSLALLETTTDEVLLQGALYNQDVADDGTLEDVIDIYWTLPGRPGFFTSRVGADINWQAQAFFQIGVKQALVRGIYDGLASKAALPSGAATGAGFGTDAAGNPIDIAAIRPALVGPPSPGGPLLI